MLQKTFSVPPLALITLHVLMSVILRERRVEKKKGIF